jgi:hypothetical protein
MLKQSSVHWKAIKLCMTGWTSFQEFFDAILRAPEIKGILVSSELRSIGHRAEDTELGSDYD